MTRRWPAVLVLVVVAAAALWWWNDRQDGGMTARELLTIEQYCPQAARLDEALGAAGVGGDIDVERFFAELGADGERVEEEAPGQVRGDVRIVMEALRQAREGDTADLVSPRFGEARNRLAAFQRDSCVGGDPGTE